MKELKRLMINDLPKVSLNSWYAGQHWSKRVKIKNAFKLILRRYKQFPKDHKYKCDYRFTFKRNALDASNCVAMVKIIEDILFEDDKWDIVTSISISSKKGKTDSMELIIEIE